MFSKKLTIGMSNWDDAEGAFWTLSAIRQYHLPADNTDVELLVVDDMPTKQEDLETICKLSSARYVHHSKNLGPAHAKNSVWEHAEGEYVLLVDSHVLLSKCSVEYILDAIDSNLIGKDLWTGPLMNESGHITATELLPEWRGAFFGVWHNNPEIHTNPVLEIEGHGSAYTLMKKEHYPFFSRHFVGFAGEELYLHELVRRNGGRCYTHKSLGWVHRFHRTKPVSYRLLIEDKLRNYLIASYEVGWSIKQCCDYFKHRVPAHLYDKILAEVKEIFPNIDFEDASGIRHKQHD